MHRAASSLADSRRLAVELSHQSLQIGALADRMAMRAVRTGNVIIVAQGEARTHNCGFLTAARVHARKLAGRRAPHGFFLESANAQHAPVPGQRSLTCEPITPELAFLRSGWLHDAGHFADRK